MSQNQQNINFVNCSVDSAPNKHRFAHEAMATTFEIIIEHKDSHYAGQAAFAAFDELDQLEAELSRFIENSDISRINNLPAKKSLRLGLPAFKCLQLCSHIYAETNGAFDITIGSLYDCWFNVDKTMRKPTQAQLDIARQHTGLHLLKLDEAEHAVELISAPVKIDLGGFGKGYAVDQMAGLLREWSIDSALIHGGASSVLAIGCPSGTKGWPVTLSNPSNLKQTLARLDLRYRALSGSGLQKGKHIIDPRTAHPIEDNFAAWACVSTAATADALSTAFMVMSPDEIEQYCLDYPDTSAMLVTKEIDKEPQKSRILHFGSWKAHELINNNISPD